MPRLVATIVAHRDDEFALNKVLSGAVAWAEPPLRLSTFDHFVEGSTFRSVAGARGNANLENKPPALPSAAGGSALDPALRLTLVPNRLLRIYECTKGHPAETALIMHCANEVVASSPEKPSLVMSRSGKLVEPGRPVQPLTTPDGDVEGSEFARQRLSELGLWMLSPTWRQKFDLVQSRVHRNVVPGSAGPRGLDWSEFKAWIRENTAWTLPEASNRAAPVTAAVVFGAGRKRGPSSTRSSVISGHNLKRNCRHTMPLGLHTHYIIPAILCD